LIESMRSTMTARVTLLFSICALLGASEVQAAGAKNKAEDKSKTVEKTDAPSDSEQAKALFAKGGSEYDLGHFEAALGFFESAYKMKNAPALLYNIAQCHRQLGNLAMARTTYRAFLSKQPGGKAADIARERLEEVERAIEAQSKARNATPTELSPMNPKESKIEPPTLAETKPAAAPTRAPAPATPTVAVVTKPLSATPPKSAAPAVAIVTQPKGPGPPQEPARVWTWVAAGAAVVAIGGGLAFGLQSKSTGDSISGSGHTGAEVSQMNDDLASQAHKANLLIGVGVGLAAVSAAFFVLHY
jgi:tetratricopeptide (TPR) repeat protein